MPERSGTELRDDVHVQSGQPPRFKALLGDNLKAGKMAVKNAWGGDNIQMDMATIRMTQPSGQSQ